MPLYQLKDSPYWWVTLVDPRTGRRIRRSSKLKDKAKARLFEEQLMASLVLGERHYAIQEENGHSWDEAANRWLRETLKNKSHAQDIKRVEWLIRGLNCYENLSICIVIGREQFPTKEVLESKARCVYWQDPVPTLSLNSTLLVSDEVIDLRDGRTVPTKKPYHHDRRVQLINEQYREEEVTQAIARIRPIDPASPQKQVFVFCSLPLPMTIVDRVVTLEEFISGGSPAERALQIFLEKAPLVPLSFRAWAATGIWKTEDQAMSHLKRKFGEQDGMIKWVVHHMNVSYMPNDPLLLVTFNRPGQRGKPSLAIVRGNEGDLLQILKTGLGQKVTIVSIREIVRQSD